METLGNNFSWEISPSITHRVLRRKREEFEIEEEENRAKKFCSDCSKGSIYTGLLLWIKKSKLFVIHRFLILIFFFNLFDSLDISTTISKRIQCLGYAYRMENNRIVMLLEDNPGGRPIFGKTKIEVQKGLRNLDVSRWRNMAMGREDWRKIVREAMDLRGLYCCKWMNDLTHWHCGIRRFIAART